jgi:hypothetical protein
MNTNFLKNEYTSIILGTLLALYSSNARIPLPEFIKQLFKNPIFRIVFLSLLLIYRFDNAPHVALTISLIFILTMHVLKSDEEKESLEYLEAYRNLKSN